MSLESVLWVISLEFSHCLFEHNMEFVIITKYCAPKTQCNFRSEAQFHWDDWQQHNAANWMKQQNNYLISIIFIKAIENVFIMLHGSCRAQMEKTTTKSKKKNDWNNIKIIKNQTKRESPPKNGFKKAKSKAISYARLNRIALSWSHAVDSLSSLLFFSLVIFFFR